METRSFWGAISDALGGTATQRGVKLGIIAGCVEIFLLFGGNALLRSSSNTVNFETGQLAPLILGFLPGFLGLVVAAALAYYAGLSAPEVKRGEVDRAGVISGSITLVLFWVGQIIFLAVDAAGSPQGLQVADFLKSRLLAGILFFVVGGALGWAGSRAAARRARSILAPPTSSLLSLSDLRTDSAPAFSNVGISPSINREARAGEKTTTTDGNEEEGEVSQEVITVDTSEDHPEEKRTI